jgi:hypothetical protein
MITLPFFKKLILYSELIQVLFRKIFSFGDIKQIRQADNEPMIKNPADNGF